MNKKNIHYENIKSLRKLAAIIFNKTGQGHPGMGISAIPLIYSVYMNMNISKNNPKWINRDRFVLSAGHGVMALYVILFFCGIIEKEDLLNFREKDSITPGHPEYNLTPHIDASTGPLGQGIGNAVGLAIAERYLENRFNKKYSIDFINHYTYAVVGDGDLQEGASYEAMSLAGKLKLNKLIVLHDSNNYQLESSVADVNIESMQKRMESMNWNYLSCSSDFEEINNMIEIAKKSDKPTFIEVKTIIGEGFSKSDSYEAHGMVVNDDEFKTFLYYWEMNSPRFDFGRKLFDFFDENIIQKGIEQENIWNQKNILDLKKNKDFRHDVLLFFQKEEYDAFLDVKIQNLSKDKATRITIGEILKTYENKDHNLFLLSPDISKSTNVKFEKGRFNDDPKFSYLQLGIREFAMGCIQNGIALHSNIKPISSSFLVFSDYFKASIRMASLMELNTIYIFTHDSVQVGADGPTHQPIEQLSTLRHIPNINVFRPADEVETLSAFNEALNSKNKPTAIILSRQNLKSDLNTNYKNAKNGGYIVYSKNEEKTPDITICASGSELELAYDLKEELEMNYNLGINIISVPNLNTFLETENIKEILKSNKGIIALEASNDSSWYKLSNYGNFLFCGINQFGKSMDGLKLYKEYGMNVQSILIKMKEDKKWI